MGERRDACTGGWQTWERRESGPPDADLTVLCLPGGMCTARSYAELMAEPALAGVHLVAVTLPGHGGTPPPQDLSVEHYAALTAGLADEIGCDAVVGFSMGANVAIEMVGCGAFEGPVVLLAPSFSRQDEAAFMRGIDRLSRVLGPLPYSAMLKMIGMAVKGNPLPPERLDELVADSRPTTRGSCAAPPTSTCGTSTGTGRSPVGWVTRTCPPGWCTARSATAASPTTNEPRSRRIPR